MAPLQPMRKLPLNLMDDDDDLLNIPKIDGIKMNLSTQQKQPIKFKIELGKRLIIDNNKQKIEEEIDGSTPKKLLKI